MSLRVVKVGGRPLADAGWLTQFGARLRASAVRTVVIHGGGPEVDELSARLGIPVERIDGLRVTTEASLDVASMVLSGRLNKRIVASLLSAGVDAVGVSGEDGALLEAEPAAGGRLGRVGRIVRVRSALLDLLLEHGIVPVVSPISRGVDGGALNVNADDAALAVARAVGAAELIYLTDVPAVRDESGPVAELDAERAAELLASGVARDGMAVKVSAALEALRAGVPSVRIGSIEMLEDTGAGTRLRAVEESWA